MLRRQWWVGGLAALLFMMIGPGCTIPQAGTKTTVTAGQDGPSIDEAQMEAYNGPKARIAVSRFTDKTRKGWYTGEIGDGMADQLVTALFNTNRYIVLERNTLDDVLQEQDLGAAGRVRADTAAAIGEIEGAELLVVGAVTEFEGNASGARGGVGGFGGGVLGAITGGFRKAHMAIDLRIIDARTSRILAATSVEGESTDVNLGGALGGFVGGGALGGALSGWKNTPTEKALRSCIQQAIEFVVSKTPQSYYHYGASGSSSQPTRTPSSAPSTTPGLSRSTVKEMQTILYSMGFDVGTPDGVAGRKTRAAVTEFQREHGLPASGELDRATIKKLREVHNASS